MLFENRNKIDKIPFINISGTNSNSYFSNNIFSIKNLKRYFEDYNSFLFILSSHKKINSKSLSSLKKPKVISIKNKYIPSRNNLLLAHPKITFKKQIYKKIKKTPHNSRLSQVEKKDTKNKKEKDVIYPKIKDEFPINFTNIQNINRVKQKDYLSPKKISFPDYNKIKINKLNNKKSIFCYENYPGKNLMNIFDKININKDEEKADKNFAENKNMNRSIDEIKNRNSKKNKSIKSYIYNVISLKKDYTNKNRIGNIKLYNFTGIKTQTPLNNHTRRKSKNIYYNKYKHNKWIKYNFNNKNFLAKNKNYKNKSFDHFINRTFSYFSYNKKKLIFKNYN